MKNKKISIITVVKNDEKNLEKTIKSVIEQSYGNIEYIIIDGASDDKTIEIIKKYQAYINNWTSEKDKGIFFAMNKGISKASGEYLNFLNSGDSFYNKESVSKIMNIANLKNPDLIYGNIEVVYDGYKVFKNKNISFLKFGKVICHQATFVKKKILEKNIFDTEHRSAADFDFFCRAMKNKISVYKLNEVIVKFKAGGFSSKKEFSYLETYKIIKKHYGKYYACRFYFLKIILEQKTKKILKKLKLNYFLKKLIEFNNKRLK